MTVASLQQSYCFLRGTAGFSSWRRYGLMSSLRHSYVFVSSGLPFVDCGTYLGRYLMHGDIYCTDFTCISYTFPFLLGTLLLCYPVTLLLCYLVTLLLCHPVTLLTLSLCYSCSDFTCISYTFPFLLGTLLLCYPVTLLPWYSVILLPCYLVTLLPCYLLTLLLCYLVTL